MSKRIFVTFLFVFMAAATLSAGKVKIPFDYYPSSLFAESTTTSAFAELTLFSEPGYSSENIPGTSVTLKNVSILLSATGKEYQSSSGNLVLLDAKYVTVCPSIPRITKANCKGDGIISVVFKNCRQYYYIATNALAKINTEDGSSQGVVSLTVDLRLEMSPNSDYVVNYVSILLEDGKSKYVYIPGVIALEHTSAQMAK